MYDLDVVDGGRGGRGEGDRSDGVVLLPGRRGQPVGGVFRGPQLPPVDGGESPRSRCPLARGSTTLPPNASKETVAPGTPLP